MGKEWKLFLWGQEEGKDAHCTTVQQSTETLRAIRWEKEIKGPQIEKEVNLSPFPHDKVS